MIINPYLKRRQFYFILLKRKGRVVHWEDAEWLAEYVGRGNRGVIA